MDFAVKIRTAVVNLTFIRRKKEFKILDADFEHVCAS